MNSESPTEGGGQPFCWKTTDTHTHTLQTCTLYILYIYTSKCIYVLRTACVPIYLISSIGFLWRDDDGNEEGSYSSSTLYGIVVAIVVSCLHGNMNTLCICVCVYIHHTLIFIICTRTHTYKQASIEEHKNSNTYECKNIIYILLGYVYGICMMMTGRLTGHVKLKWNAIGVALAGNVKLFSPSTGVTTSPNVHVEFTFMLVS